MPSAPLGYFSVSSEDGTFTISCAHTIPNYFLGLSLLTIGVAGDFARSGEGFLFTQDFLVKVDCC